MTAAHELVSRGYQVRVIEKHPTIVGGRARSEPVPGTANDGRQALPGEHGFRFFPGFYRHLDHTMRRIPFPGRRRGVFDNLVHIGEGLYAQYRGAPAPTLMRIPRSRHEWRIATSIRANNSALGISAADWGYAWDRMWQFMTSCHDRRLAEYENQSWWDFVGADKRSAAYQDVFATGQTQLLVACRARDASARSMAQVGAQFLWQMTRPSGIGVRILDGPTHEAWLGPWHDHLRALGVEWISGEEVVGLNHAGRRIVSVELRNQTLTADWYVCALPLAAAATLTKPLVELDPAIAGLSTLCTNLRWMSGVQFFLEKPLEGLRSHVVCLGSPWALTAINSERHWSRVDLSRLGDGRARCQLSVDVSNFDAPGLADGPSRGRRAKDCDRATLRDEVWAQLRRVLPGAGIDLPESWVHAHVDSALREVPDGAGRVRLVNDDPLLVNRAGSWRLRPEARSLLDNLVFAGDYVRTHTDLVCMEGANESARRACNVILGRDRVESSVDVWPLHEPAPLRVLQSLDQRRFNRGLHWKHHGPQFS